MTSIPDEFIGKAKCGCVYHAEEGTACPHDIVLYRAAKRAELIEKLRPLVELQKQVIALAQLVDQESAVPGKSLCAIYLNGTISEAGLLDALTYTSTGVDK